jgi:regulator of replication initiation timing
MLLVDIGRLLRDNDTLRAENENLRSPIRRLSADVLASLASEREIEQLKAVNTQLAKTYDELVKEKEQLLEMNDKLRKTNDELRDRLTRVETELGGLREMSRHLGVREVASNIEQNVMMHIFPACSRRPYFLKGLVNLQRFIADPTPDPGICGPGAADSFAQLGTIAVQDIRDRLARVHERFGDQIAFEIRRLKTDGTRVAHAAPDIATLLVAVRARSSDASTTDDERQTAADVATGLEMCKAVDAWLTQVGRR